MEDEIGWSQVYDTQTQKCLVKILVAQCDLAVQLTDVIMTVYPLDGSPPVAPNSAEGLQESSAHIAGMKDRLIKWLAKFRHWASVHTEAGETHVSVKLYINLLYMYYQYV